MAQDLSKNRGILDRTYCDISKKLNKYISHTLKAFSS